MRWLQQFFSLEALDTRLAAPADYKKKDAVVKKAAPSRWGTLEFKIYYLVFLVVVPLMIKTCMDASNETNPNYPKFQHKLSPGWIFGRQVDNSDTQYSFFRNNFWLLMGLMAGHTLLRLGVDEIHPVKRSHFDLVVGIVYLVALHGVNVSKIAVHVVINYFLRYLPRKYAIGATWVYGVSTLFINDRLRDNPIGLALVDDGFMGIVRRWDVFFNFTVLRMISFNMDYLENKDNAEKSSEPTVVVAGLDDRQRLVAPLDLSDYNFTNYLAYLTYAPLFLAGPVITFNDYMYQSNYFPSRQSLQRLGVYFARFLFCVLTMEFVLHYMYVVAVSNTKAWDGDTPFQISMIGLFSLNVVWLKLLIPWRFFRLWALVDGIDPPENMIRCVDNNFSALAFWRAWHRSFNRWVIRYIYVPLGGGGHNRVVNSLLVFSFVAIWHDIELKLLIWGWLIVLFLLPELAATTYFARYRDEWWYRHVCALGSTVNIWMMMIANLFGFCLGKDGTIKMLHELFQTVHGFFFFIVASSCLYVASHVMFERRQDEIRRGVYVRC
ncbi:membrane-bound O-acyltransferase Gup1p [Diutina catenulata]